MGRARDDSGARPGDRLSGLWAAIITLLALYFLPLLVVAVDELVLGTYGVTKIFPGERMREVFFVVYPFLRFIVE